MSDTRDSEIRAIEGDPSVGNSREAATPGSRAGRIGLRDLLRRPHLRRGWRRARLFWTALTSFTLTVSAVFTVVVIAMLLIQELTRGAIAIEPISVPKELAENGYAPEVAARRLRDAVNAFAVEAK